MKDDKDAENSRIADYNNRIRVCNDIITKKTDYSYTGCVQDFNGCRDNPRKIAEFIVECTPDFTCSNTCNGNPDTD